MSLSVKELEKQILDLNKRHKADMELVLKITASIQEQFPVIQDFVEKQCHEAWYKSIEAFKGIADEQMKFNNRLKQLEALQEKFQNPMSAPFCTSQTAAPSETTTKVEKALMDPFSLNAAFKGITDVQIAINTRMEILEQSAEKSQISKTSHPCPKVPNAASTEALPDAILQIKSDVATLSSQLESLQKESQVAAAHLHKLDNNNKNTAPVTPCPLLHEIKLEMSNLSSQVQSLQVDSKKNNLVFYGVPEGEKSESELFSKIEKLVVEEMDEPISSSPVCNFSTFRIGQRNPQPSPHSRPRPVKVYFPNLAERNAVWKARSLLCGSPFAVNEDLPLSVRIQRAVSRKQNQQPPKQLHRPSDDSKGTSRKSQNRSPQPFSKKQLKS